MPLACWNCNSTKLSMHCQHAEGMSLRYTVIELGYRELFAALAGGAFCAGAFAALGCATACRIATLATLLTA